MGVLAKVIVLDRVEVLEDGTLQFRYARYVTEDGERISAPEYHRSSAEPGMDLTGAKVQLFSDRVLVDLSDRVKAVAAAVWTPDVVQAHQDKVRAAIGDAVVAQLRGR